MPFYISDKDSKSWWCTNYLGPWHYNPIQDFRVMVTTAHTRTSLDMIQRPIHNSTSLRSILVNLPLLSVKWKFILCTLYVVDRRSCTLNLQHIKSKDLMGKLHARIWYVCSGHEDAATESSVWSPTLTTQFRCSQQVAWFNRRSPGSGLVWIIMGFVNSIYSIRPLCHHVSRPWESATVSTASTCV